MAGGGVSESLQLIKVLGGICKPLTPCSMHLFCLFLSCILYNKLAIISKLFSCVL